VTAPLSRRALLLAATALLLGAPAALRAVDNAGKGPNPAFVEKVDALLADPGLKGGFQGVWVQSLASGRVWYERNADLLFVPASNQKLLTSAAALHTLGPDFRWVTTLDRKGSLDDDGTFHGHLYLKGSGDPYLRDTDLDPFVDSVKASGIRRVKGKLIADDSRFDRELYGSGWSWDDMPYYYSAQVSALNLNGNLVTVDPEPARKAGDAVTVTVTPAASYARVVVRARTVEKGEPSKLTITRALGQNEITVDGVLAIGTRAEDHAPVRVTVEEPALYAASVLRDKLRRAGVEVTGGIERGVTPEGVSPVAQHRGEPLSEGLKRLNKPSDNLAAECLLKTLGAEKGKTGSIAAGREAARAWFKEVGMDPEAIRMEDGSGLSRLNFVTPRAYASMLLAMAAHPHATTFIESLPVAGVDGTLRSRMKGTLAEKNAKAKSGYVSNVSSLSGYVSTKSGEPLLFVMLMNNHPSRNAVPMAVQNRIVELLAGWE
jgi:D-alanyl-D-alanine carboxypeptidase/D-alanyl-D-alanine-endopeptidase (penicillin-binding protein 4)